MALFARFPTDWLASVLSLGGPAGLGLLVGIEIGRPGAGAVWGLLAGLVVVALFGWRRRQDLEGDEG